jgi:hypothetical protein
MANTAGAALKAKIALTAKLIFDNLILPSPFLIFGFKKTTRRVVDKYGCFIAELLHFYYIGMPSGLGGQK